MGLLDFSGFVGDDTVKDEFGMTQADRRQPLFTGLLKAGMLGMAAGENITPGQRAQLMGQVGGAITDIPEAMNRNRAEAAQMQIRRQQFQTNQQKLEQAQKLRAYAKTPEYAELIKDAPPHIKAGLNFAIEAGDADSVQRLLSGIDTTAARSRGLDIRQAEIDRKAAEDAKKAENKGSFGNTLPGIHAENLRKGAAPGGDPSTYEYWLAHQFYSTDQRNPDGTIIPKLPYLDSLPKPTWTPAGAPAASAPTPAPGAPPVPGAPRAPVIAPDAPITPDLIKQQIAPTMKPTDEKVVNGVEFYMDREGRVEWDTGTERYRLNKDGTVATLPALKSDEKRETGLIKNNTTISKLDRALEHLKNNPQAWLGIAGMLPDAVLQRTDPEGQPLRDLLKDLSGVVIHDRSGANVTKAEEPRLDFLPKKGDTPEIIKGRLEDMKRYVDEETRQAYLTGKREYKMPPAIKERYGKGGGGAPTPSAPGGGPKLNPGEQNLGPANGGGFIIQLPNGDKVVRGG